MKSSRSELPDARLHAAVRSPAWLPAALRGERDQLFITYLAILCSANAAFAIVSLGLGYAAGVGLHLGGLGLSLLLFGLRWKGQPLNRLIRTMQWALTFQAMALAWTSGGIFSPMLGWLALAVLPAVVERSVNHGRAWIGGAALLILGLYAYALLGGQVDLGIAPVQLVHWHLLVALLVLAMQWVLLQRFQVMRAQRIERVRQHSLHLQQLREQLVQAHRQKDMFMASVCHELRTPMNAILGLADLIHHDPELSEDVRAKASNIQKSSEHLLTLINDLMDYSQIEAGALKIVQESFDLHDTLRTAYSILQARALSKPIRYLLDIGQDVPAWISGDAHRLTQVLVNLLGNAVKFTDSGEVRLQCRFEESLEDSQSGVLHLEVSDTGIGIAEQDQHKLFERFVQADPSIARRFGGNGLGLSITRHLVQAMGGTIALQSALGRGSRFSVALPCRVEPQPRRSGVSDKLIPDAGPVRILIVDDNPLNRQVASLQLRRQLVDAEVMEAENGLKALESIRTNDFDVVLLDLQMPGMDGFETARRVRTELPEARRSVPIIALTANNDTRELEKCLAIGMNATMLKPFDRVQLCKKVLEHAQR